MSDVAEAEVVEAEVEQPEEDEESTELAVRAESTLSLPSPDEWNAIEHMAERLSQSGIVPRAFRGRPADILAAILTGRELGWGAMSAMQRIHVIEGKPSLAAEAMVGLVRRAHHSIKQVESSSERVVVTGRRTDNGDEMTVEWTMDKARNAGLAGKDNWKRHPESMLWARAVSRLCRQLFPDVLMGYTYTPDELGDVVDAEVVEEEPVQLPPELQEMRGTWSEQEIADAANELRAALDPPLPPKNFIALRQSSPEALAKVKAKLESSGAEPSEAKRAGSEVLGESSDTEEGSGPPERETAAAEQTAPSSPRPVERPCPECGDPVEHDGKRWSCFCGWESFHTDPWKPGGEVEQLLAIKELPQEDQDLIASFREMTAAEIIAMVDAVDDREQLERYQMANENAKGLKTVRKVILSKLETPQEEDPAPEPEPEPKQETLG